MNSKLKEILHTYKRDVFRVQHDKKDVGEITQECMALCEDVLAQKYSYHFHRLADANRAEIINMINNYTREAILPPVVQKLVHRQVVLEHRVHALERLLETTLEALAENGASVEPSAR